MEYLKDPFWVTSYSHMYKRDNECHIIQFVIICRWWYGIFISLKYNTPLTTWINNYRNWHPSFFQINQTKNSIFTPNINKLYSQNKTKQYPCFTWELTTFLGAHIDELGKLKYINISILIDWCPICPKWNKTYTCIATWSS